MISTTRTPAPVSFERLASGAMFEHGQSSGRSWRSPAAAIVAAVALQASTNLRARGIALGFDFLGRRRLRDRSGPHRILVAGHLRSRPLRRPAQHAARSLTGIVIATAQRRRASRDFERVGRRHRRTLLPRSDSEHSLLVQLLFWYALTQELRARARL